MTSEEQTPHWPHYALPMLGKYILNKLRQNWSKITLNENRFWDVRLKFEEKKIRILLLNKIINL